MAKKINGQRVGIYKSPKSYKWQKNIYENWLTSEINYKFKNTIFFHPTRKHLKVSNTGKSVGKKLTSYTLYQPAIHLQYISPKETTTHKDKEACRRMLDKSFIFNNEKSEISIHHF